MVSGECRVASVGEGRRAAPVLGVDVGGAGRGGRVREGGRREARRGVEAARPRRTSVLADVRARVRECATDTTARRRPCCGLTWPNGASTNRGSSCAHVTTHVTRPANGERPTRAHAAPPDSCTALPPASPRGSLSFPKTNEARSL
ncbi:uncharacterized protein LOC143920232 [Arctopsyche grandis]|uniref:uncharacterized protein LOC143920232 n=1 Tax=Arctopsyche grandis TaxID=121162 RepID=UPI00406D7AE4